MSDDIAVELIGIEKRFPKEFAIAIAVGDAKGPVASHGMNCDGAKCA